MLPLLVKSAVFVLSFSSAMSFADSSSFTLKSDDIRSNEMMPVAQEFKGFGCSGGNVSPQLSWSNPPMGTAAFAVTAYDPDAPTGSGWWHWQVVNIPADVRGLAADAGDSATQSLPKGSIQIKNDYGFSGFGGACPPKGHGTHRYQFTVHALSKPLELPEDASGALTGYMINAHSIAKSTIEALYRRD
ncbi:YbhB/YbcL family Raf kinase inhibitor-like protein [Marinomonas sp. 2405UD68-3]|uniref:YbhB/YbcL family Raf kinase inhibitor-like protein n=1 Tax=Marinomonas sp. 2405UD68-3 TaxID=3391835 RepID=UPI0039C927D9